MHADRHFVSCEFAPFYDLRVTVNIDNGSLTRRNSDNRIFRVEKTKT